MNPDTTQDFRSIEQLEADLAELSAKRAEAERLIAEHKAQKRTDAIAHIRAQMAAHGITVADLQCKSVVKRVAVQTERKAPVKFADIAGNQWSGRGQVPRWIRDARISAGVPSMDARQFAERFRVGGAA